METLSAFLGSYLEEIMSTISILSNLATVSEYPFFLEDKTNILCSLCGNE